MHIEISAVHGLGHLIEPYKDEDALPDLPKPRVPLSELGVRRWQHDFWIKIVEAAIVGDPDRVRLNWHPSLALPAAQRFSASSPQLLAWLDHWNAGKPYEEQIRPFGFLLVYTAKTGVFADPPDLECCIEDEPGRGRPPRRDVLKPIAPFATDPVRALANAIDRVTGDLIESVNLKTYAETLCQYHLSSEDKFENGLFLAQGRTHRRHVVAAEAVRIGKEANRIGDSGESDPIVSAVEDLRHSG